MSVPGPPALVWGMALLLWAVAMLPLGEVLRRFGARWSGLLRASDPVERFLVDLYIAGSVLYVVGSLPVGLFLDATPTALILAGGALLILELARRAPAPWPLPRVAWNEVRSPALLVTVATTIGLFAVEVMSAVAAPTGNTFDSSALATFVGLTGLHHQLPYSLAPVAPVLSAYPQGITAWLAAGQFLFGLPPARTSLLVTPLFLAMAPLGGYVWGRRWFGTPAAGAAIGLTLGLVATWTRTLGAGSNDFVFAFPLVLLLWAHLPRLTSAPVPSRADALAFGALLGYAAALNPTGPELTVLVLPCWAVASRARATIGLRAWWARYAMTVGAGALVVLPSLLALVRGAGAGAARANAAAPLTPSSVVGLIDPLLFRPTDIFLSPFPTLRAELAVLLVVGVALAAWPSRWSDRHERELLSFALVVLLLGTLLLVLASSFAASSGLVGAVSVLTNPLQVGILIFTGYAALASLPLRRCLDLLARYSPTRPEPSARTAPSTVRDRRSVPAPHGALTRPLVALALAAVILVPGAAVTAGSLGPYLDATYGRFGNVSAADFDLLAWAPAHLPAGARVLVAPGSAAQFLPAYLPTLVVVYPVLPLAANATYQGLVHELDRGVLTAAGRANLSALAIDDIAVTQNNTALWAPFDPTPLLADPSEFPVLFHEGDAYLFGVGPQG